MNRSCRSPLHHAFLSLAIVLALSACRSPVQGRAQGSLSLSLSIPADLSSDVPEPIRRALGEAELADARPRFIHPDGKTVTAIVTRADGSYVGSATASLETGAASATLGIADLPLNEPLTLTVTVYDAGNAIVGERVVEIGALSEAQNVLTQSVNIVPVACSTIKLGEFNSDDQQSPGVAIVDKASSTLVYSILLSSVGEYRARLLHGGEVPIGGLSIYSQEGLKLQTFSPAYEDSNYVRLIKDSNTEETYFIIFNVAENYTPYLSLDVIKCEPKMVVWGRTNDLDTEDILLTSGASIQFSQVDTTNLTSSSNITIYNNGSYDLKILSCRFEMITNSVSFSIPSPPAGVIPPLSSVIVECVFSYNSSHPYDNSGNLIIETDDPDESTFLLSFSGINS